jgi:hypothetical protein
MKEFDELMKALEAWSNIMLQFGGLKWAPLALQNAYLAFKAAPEPLVLEQDTSLDFQKMPKVFINSDGLYCVFHNEKVYKLPEEA